MWQRSVDRQSPTGPAFMLWSDAASPAEKGRSVSLGPAGAVIDGGSGLRVSIDPVEVERLPAVTEDYVRGDQWHAWLPQTDADLISLKLVFGVIASTPTRWVVEVTLAIQTLLLDTHPTLDLAVSGDPWGTQDGGGPRPGHGCPPASSVRLAEGGGEMLVLLGGNDAPFTGQHSTSDELRLRLFGEFLEKGVIRKARPWLVFDTSGSGVSPKEANELLAQLEATPLPLTP